MDEHKTILIVEDDAVTAGLLDSVLKKAGYEVVIVTNGQEALRVSARKNPDLIISDVLMPGMDGYNFFKELKKNPALANIPVIIMTARVKMEDTFIVLGVDDFLTKPFVTEVLLEKVKGLLLRGKASSLPMEFKDNLELSPSSPPRNFAVYFMAFFVAVLVVACVFMFRSLFSAQKSVADLAAEQEKDSGDDQPLTPQQEKAVNELELR